MYIYLLNCYFHSPLLFFGLNLIDFITTYHQDIIFITFSASALLFILFSISNFSISCSSTLKILDVIILLIIKY